MFFWPLFSEAIDEFMQALKRFSFSTFYEEIKKKIKDALDNIDSIEIAYYSGHIAGLVIEAIISILYTGGTLTIANIVQEMTALLRLAAKGAKNIVKFGTNKAKSIIEYIKNSTKFVDEGAEKTSKIVDGFLEEVLVKVSKRNIERFKNEIEELKNPPKQ